MRSFRRKGSGLIIALSVLAMLAVMATSFITLSRLEVRITTNYVDDMRCEMLAKGVLSYYEALLRDDLDRTWGKYENRDTAVGAVGWQWSSTGGGIAVRLPGVNTYKYGTAMSNDFWFNPPYKAWTDWGNLFVGEYDDAGVWQQTFSGGTGYSRGAVARYWDSANNREFDAWIGRSLCSWHKNSTPTQRVMVHKEHPDASSEGVDFNGDGAYLASPPYTQNPSTGSYNVSNGSFWNEEQSDTRVYHDTAPFMLYSGDAYYFPGYLMTGQEAMPGPLFWRYAAKLGVAHGAYMNLNTAGNLLYLDSSLLNDMGGVGLGTRRAVDETMVMTETGVPTLKHYGRISWRGFPGEYNYENRTWENQDGFPRFYNEVDYHPSQLSLEKLFHRYLFSQVTYNSWDIQEGFDLYMDRRKAQDLVAWRNGGDGKPADSDKWRLGWRRDGASYFKLPSPDNPRGDDRPYGANDVMEHDHAVYHGDTSAVAKVLNDRGAWSKLKPYVTMWSTDTILRGKIWPAEGPLPWHAAAPGDWRHIDILKRVNVNILGAKRQGLRPGDPSGEESLKNKWADKAVRERARLYWMLMAAMDFSQIPDTPAKRRREACQFIASLTDMVDRDHNEQYFGAQLHAGDTSAPADAWALGYERHAVINEAAVYLREADKADYDMFRMRVELYNPAENVPWIPDADEAYDVSDYVIKVGSHAYRVGDLTRYDPADPNNLYTRDGSNGKVTKIGADGLYAVDQPAGTTWHPTWTRLMHLGWSDANVTDGSGWPKGVTHATMDARVRISLWKPLSTLADDGNPAGNIATANDKVEDLTPVGTSVTRRYVCVDHTGDIRLVRPYDTAKGETGPGVVRGDTNWDGTRTSYAAGGALLPDTTLTKTSAAFVGVYRRWDALNGENFERGKPPYTGSGNAQTRTRPHEVIEGKSDESNVQWLMGYNLINGPTLGRPNANYPREAFGPNYDKWGVFKQRRHYERNVKVVDGDLPSVGWLGEVIMWNAAKDGPVTWVHGEGQEPMYEGQVSYHEGYRSSSSMVKRGWANKIDTRAKFDLYRPFSKVDWGPEGEWDPHGTWSHTENLHVLDIFTVWDPSNDGVDNDGDGAIDDDDTGRQTGDKGGPEVRVFGRVDLNLAPRRVIETVWPMNPYCHQTLTFCSTVKSGRMQQRQEVGYGSWGPMETLGDMLRADPITFRPGYWLAGGSSAWQSGPQYLNEAGFRSFDTDPNHWTSNPEYQPPDPSNTWVGDDDGDGLFDERDERDMIFTWVSNHFTTRSNVFELDVVVDVSDPPYYAEEGGNPRKVPFRASKTRKSYARKQLLGILDRSTCLRINSDGSCEFTGPVGVRMLRFTDDARVN